MEIKKTLLTRQTTTRLFMIHSDLPCRDETWFRDLYRTHYRDIVAYARRRTNQCSADDIAANTFMLAWQKRFEIPEDNERVWLFGVARNLALNDKRTSRRKDALLQRLRSQAKSDQDQNSFPESKDYGYSEQLQIALNQLPATDKEILMLLCWEELSYNEISEILYETPNALRIRSYRARKLLAKKLIKITLQGE
ncbi:MAG: RNA polymerase sigma factor [bacterium]|nr:RNA polymerase sigma factor [bacterium]